MAISVIHGDCRELAPAIPMVDAIVTDPPYHLTTAKRFGKASSAPAKSDGATGVYKRSSSGFMGQAWDGGDVAFDPTTWAALMETMKPGAHLAAFDGSRTFHRLVCAIEDAGFEIRDTVFWLYGSGFPKGHDTAAGVAKEITCQSNENAPLAAQCSKHIRLQLNEAKESIVVALAQILPGGAPALVTQIGEEVALSVLTDTSLSELIETTGLSIDLRWNALSDVDFKFMSKCITETVSSTIIDSRTWSLLIGLHTSATTTRCSETLQNGSKWPAFTAENLTLDGGVFSGNIRMLSAIGPATWNTFVKFAGLNVALKPAFEPVVIARKPMSEKSVARNVLRWGTGGINIDACRVPAESDATGGRWPANICHDGSDEASAEFPNGAARYFYCAKAGKADRAGSKHPTVKPQALMRWLIRMIAPPSGVILDPFAGSGSTLAAAGTEGFDAIGCDITEQWIDEMELRFGVQAPPLWMLL